MPNPSRATIWNALLTILGVALTAWMGWISMTVIELQAEHFTEAEGAQLRQDITDITTDIDKRLSLSENDTRWVKSIMISAGGIDHHTFDNVGNALPPNAPTPIPPVPIPYPDPLQPVPAPSPAYVPDQDGPEQIRKYDLRGKK